MIITIDDGEAQSSYISSKASASAGGSAVGVVVILLLIVVGYVAFARKEEIKEYLGYDTENTTLSLIDDVHLLAQGEIPDIETFWVAEEKAIELTPSLQAPRLPPFVHPSRMQDESGPSARRPSEVGQYESGPYSPGNSRGAPPGLNLSNNGGYTGGVGSGAYAVDQVTRLGNMQLGSGLGDSTDDWAGIPREPVTPGPGQMSPGGYFGNAGNNGGSTPQLINLRPLGDMQRQPTKRYSTTDLSGAYNPSAHNTPRFGVQRAPSNQFVFDGTGGGGGGGGTSGVEQQLLAGAVTAPNFQGLGMVNQNGIQINPMLNTSQYGQPMNMSTFGLPGDPPLSPGPAASAPMGEYLDVNGAVGGGASLLGGSHELRLSSFELNPGDLGLALGLPAVALDGEGDDDEVEDTRL